MMLDLTRVSCLGELLRDAVLTFKSNVALIEADRHRDNVRYSYRELRGEAERIARRLQQRDFKSGDRCAILMSNQAKWVLSSTGALWAGAVLIPLDYKLTPAEQLRLIAHSKPRVLIIEYPVFRSFAQEPASARDVLGQVRVLVTEAPAGAELGAAERWEELATREDVAAASAKFQPVARNRDDIACIVYSSGTFGTPKGCMLTHDNYLAQAEVLAPMFPMGEDDRYFSILPTNHAIDFMCGTIIPFLFGAAVVHQRTLRAEFLAPTMQRHRVTHMALVPRIMRALADKIREQLDALPVWQKRAIDSLIAVNDLATQRVPNHRLSSLLLKPIHDRFGGRLRTIVAGGAYVEPDLAQFFYRLGFPVAIGYGLTEACTVLSVNDLKPFRATTVGRAVPGVELELRDLDAAGVGEVYARGRTIMHGYLDAPELTAESLVDGWLRTGDLGSLDAAGHLRLYGRVKNMIVTEGGKNVYPEDLEAMFESVDCEELCAFAANYLWPERGLGGQREQITLIVRARKQYEPRKLAAQIAAANLRLADYKRVATYLLWADEFPRTASMKIKRDELARKVRGAGNAAQLLQAS